MMMMMMMAMTMPVISECTLFAEALKLTNHRVHNLSLGMRCLIGQQIGKIDKLYLCAHVLRW